MCKTAVVAHEGLKKCHQRNANVRAILKGARVGNKELDLGCQFHHAFWFGDMNYRLQFTDDAADGKALSSPQVKAMKDKKAVREKVR